MRKWHLTVMTLLVVLVTTSVIADRWLRPYDLAAERAAARAAGLPLVPGDLHRPKPPPGQDAAPVWNALADLLSRRPLDGAMDYVLYSGDPGFMPTPGQVRSVLHGRGDVAARIAAITRCSGAYFPHAWTADELFSYGGTMRQASGFVQAQALAAARRGRYEEAIRIQARGFRIADHAAMDPLVLSFLVSTTIDDETLRGLGRILQLAGPNAKAAALVRRAIKENPSRRRVDLPVLGQALFSVMLARRARSVDEYRTFFAVDDLVFRSPPDPPAPPRHPRPNGLVIQYASEPAEAAYLHRLRPYIAAARLPEPVRTARFQYLDRRPMTPRPFAFGDALAAMLSVPLSELPERDTEAAARRAVLLAAADVMAYRARNGRWPARLENATPAAPLDPFSGKPLRYRQEADGFVVRSAGRAFGARPQPIAYRYPAPPPKGMP